MAPDGASYRPPGTPAAVPTLTSSASAPPVVTPAAPSGARQGMLEGAILFYGDACAPPATSAPQPGNCTGPYAHATLPLYAADGVTKVGQFITDANADFRLALAAGRYVLYTPARGDPQHRRRQEVTVYPGDATRLYIIYDSGAR